METTLALVKVTYYDEFDDEERTIYGVLHGKTMREIGEELDDWIGKDLMTVEVKPLAPGALEISQEIFEELWKEN